MARQMNIEFRDFTGLNLSSAVPYKSPRYQAPGRAEQAVVRAGIGAAAAASNSGRIMADILAFEDSRPGDVRVGGGIPGTRMIKPHPDITYAFGLTASIGAITALGVAGGVYFWAKFPGFEVGTYTAGSIGVMTNVGYSAGGELTIYFGPAPAMLAGDSIAVAVDVGIGGLTVSGQVILSAPPAGLGPPLVIPPGWTPDVIGVAFSLTAGWSALPASISVMPTRTAIRSIVSR